MPTRDEHIEQITRNKELLNTEVLHPSITKYVEWSITIMFYTAVHLIEYNLAPNYHSKNHNDREKVMYKNSSFKRIFQDYKALKATCWSARYMCGGRSREDAVTCMQHLDKIERELKPA
ncbi:MAG: hypothetical protein GXZ09_05870 [Syntrophomonadaceae bacterium]|jgi:hypothetical protein|nr:hypothetical protein [Syntrophomonadaceae bacterium]